MKVGVRELMITLTHFNSNDIYERSDLSFSYLIANLIDIVCDGLNYRYWFSSPIQGTKEINRIRTMNLFNSKAQRNKKIR